jgi:large subunit ribosomal protein L25
MELAAQKRSAGKANALRREGHIPGIVYNKELNIPISVELRAFDKVFRTQGTSSIIDLSIAGDETREVLVKAVQMDKRRRIPQHVDFYAVTAGQAVEVNVHIEFEGTPQGVKDGGLLDIQKREVLISILPRLIPHHVELDISKLLIGNSLHLSDVVGNLPAEAKVLDDLNTTVVAVVPPRAEPTPEVAAAAPTEPEVISKGKEKTEEE